MKSYFWLTILVAWCLPSLAQSTATATAVLAGQFVVDAVVTDGGSGYVAPPVVTFSGGGGSGAAAQASIADGRVVKISVLQAGSGYTNAPAIVIDSPGDFIKRGLTAYYPLDGNAKDQAGHNDGTVHGAVLTADRFGHTNSAYRFNGNGAYIQMASQLPEMTSATISLWVAFDDWAGYQMLFFEGDTGPGHDLAGLYDANFSFVTKDDSGLGFRNWLPPLHTWTHLACVADAAARTVQLWINGALVSTNAFAGGANIGYHSEFSLGHRGGYNDWFFIGSMDEVRVYNRALSGPEVSALYAQQAGRPVDLAIAVKTLQLTMNVMPGKAYQLQSSADLANWTSQGGVFVPTTATITQEVDAAESGRYWRLIEAP